MQQFVYSDKPGTAANGWQPDRDEDYGDEVRLAASAPMPPNPTRSAFGPTQSMLIEQRPVSPAAYAPTRQALPQVPAATHQAILPAPPASAQANRPETLLEVGPFRTVMLPTMPSVSAQPRTLRDGTPSAQALDRLAIAGRIATSLFTLALLTLIFSKFWLLLPLLWVASIWGLRNWARQHGPRYSFTGRVVEFNFESITAVAEFAMNLILAMFAHGW